MTKITKCSFLLLLFCIGLMGSIHAQEVSSDATLKALTISEGILSPAFDASTEKYTVSIPKSITTVNISAEATDENAVVSGDTGELSFVAERDTFTVIVTAEDGTTTKNYEIIATRASKYTIKATVHNNYGGVIRLEDGIIPESGIVEVEDNLEYIFSYYANINYEISNVLIDGVSDEEAISNGAYTFSNVNNDHTIEIFCVSTDATLKTLTVNKGILNPNFSPDEYIYTVEVPKETSDILISATVNYDSTRISGDIGIQTLSSGDNEFSIICYAENENTQVYHVNIIREPYIITSNVRNDYGGNISPIGNTEVSAGSSQSYTFTASNSYILKDILVDNTSEPDSIAKKSYTFTNINADHTIEAIFASTEARLSNISVSNGTLSPAFDAETYEYTVNADNSVSTINIIGTAIHSGASFMNINNAALQSGENVFTIEVTAEDGNSKKTYKITVNRGKSNDALLSGLSISDGTLSPAFNPNTKNYIVYVTNNITKITINGTARNSKANVGGNLTSEPLNVGENEFTLTVTAENGAVEKYTINVIRAYSADATLKSLTVSKGTLNPIFNANTETYSVSVSYEIEKITITGEANHSEAYVTGNISEDTLVVGENLFEITVFAENNESKTYTVTVTRAKSTDATLKGVTVNNNPISNFLPTTTEYTVNVANEVERATVIGIANHVEATVTGNVSDVALEPGENTFTIRVIAQNGMPKEYKITVIRGKSADAALRSLTVVGGVLTPVFNANRTEYTVNVAHHIEIISITGIANNEKATVKNSVSDAPLIVGNNSFSIEVEAEDGTPKNYNITVVRAKSPDPTLKSITLSSGELSPAFNANTIAYVVNVERDIDIIDITAETTHEQATVEGNVVDSTLYLGDNIFVFEVTAADEKATKTYTVNVIRGKSKDANLKSLTVSSGKLTPEFDANTTAYEVNVENNITSINITGVVNHSEANITENIEDAKLTPGENTFEIEVVAEDEDTKKIYTITVFRAKSTHADLQNITASKGTLSPAFSANTTNYTIEVNDNVTTISIKGTAIHEQAQVKGNVMGAALDYGENIFEIKVIAEDGETSKDYKVTVTRNKNNSIDNIEKHIDLTLYPNPATDILFIKSIEPIQNIAIYNIEGKMKKQINGDVHSINVSDLTKGLYFMRIATKQGEIIKKIIIK